MKIAIFSIGTSEAKMMAEKAQLRGHTAKVSLFQTEEDREWLKQADIFIARYFNKTYNLVCETVAWFEKHNPTGVVTTSSEGIKNSFDKYLSHQILQQNGIPTPSTYLVQGNQDLKALTKELPLILKPRSENQGRGIEVVHTPEMLQLHAQDLLDEYKTCIAQTFIAESAGKDVRAFVIGNEVVASMERRAPEGSITANLSKGGTAIAIELDKDAVNLALAVNKAFESHISGVDLLRTHAGWVVIENNTSPGFMLSEIAKVDLAGRSIDYLVQLRRERI